MPALRHSADLSRGGRCNPNDGEADGSNTIWKLGRAWIFRKVFVGSSIIFQVEEPTMAEAHNGHEAVHWLWSSTASSAVLRMATLSMAAGAGSTPGQVVEDLST